MDLGWLTPFKTNISDVEYQATEKGPEQRVRECVSRLRPSAVVERSAHWRFRQVTGGDRAEGQDKVSMPPKENEKIRRLLSKAWSRRRRKADSRLFAMPFTWISIGNSRSSTAKALRSSSLSSFLFQALLVFVALSAS